MFAFVAVAVAASVHSVVDVLNDIHLVDCYLDFFYFFFFFSLIFDPMTNRKKD